MPATYEIDTASRLVRTHAWGELTDADLTEYYRRLRADPDFQPTFNQFCDLRTVSRIAATPQGLRTLARTKVFAPSARRAFLTSSEADFGLARMFQTYSELEGSTIGVFKREEDAIAWLATPIEPKQQK
jgi:hypothetical protein